MTESPYRLDGPALVSFSGGRTSAYMLHEILRVHDGLLPDGSVVAFANTGKERPETLAFVAACASHWNVRIRWVEFRKGESGFEEVGPNSASRSGEPFAALIAGKSYLPNWQARFCTSFLKVQPMFALMLSEHGLSPGQFSENIGLRHDEGMRILRGLERAENEGRRVRYPLAKARIVKADVLAFWARQPFDLGLQSWEGNCDLCFMKGRRIRKRIIRDNPASAVWWKQMEEVTGGFFDRRDRVDQLIDEVRKSPTFFDEVDDSEYDVECGDGCGVEA